MQLGLLKKIVHKLLHNVENYCYDILIKVALLIPSALMWKAQAQILLIAAMLVEQQFFKIVIHAYQ